MKKKNYPDNFEKILDKALEKQAKTILDGVNFSFENFREENKKEHKRLEDKIDETRSLIDGYVKDQEDFKQEFEIIKYKNGKIEKVIKDKLKVEIK